MFVIPALVTVAAGTVLAGLAGFNVFTSFQNKVDTAAEAKIFFRELGMTAIGLCALVTALHSLWG